MTPGFKDYFSDRSDGYAKYRPGYPPELFRFLAAVAPDRQRAWDCATGSGQAATALAEHFAEVLASDASGSQIDAAMPNPGVTYRVASAESSGLASGSVALVTVGQAFHWFEASAFWREAKRVLRPNGVLAIWCYGVCEISDECDAIVATLYHDIVGEFWPPERELIERRYADIDLPGRPIAAPDLSMVADWQVDEMLGYLRTWSACSRYREARGSDPVTQIAASLRQAWGDLPRRVSWPLTLKASQLNSLLE